MSIQFFLYKVLLLNSPCFVFFLNILITVILKSISDNCIIWVNGRFVSIDSFFTPLLVFSHKVLSVGYAGNLLLNAGYL